MGSKEDLVQDVMEKLSAQIAASDDMMRNAVEDPTWAAQNPKFLIALLNYMSAKHESGVAAEKFAKAMDLDDQG